jgi:hypothetical protein
VSKWTTQRPTKPGWYWAQWVAGGTEFVVYVRWSNLCDDILIALQVGDKTEIHLSELDNFQGPIHPKKD